jgi:hypothetical protein
MLSLYYVLTFCVQRLNSAGLNLAALALLTQGKTKDARAMLKASNSAGKEPSETLWKFYQDAAKKVRTFTGRLI